MGILNATPDSFFDGGRHHYLDAAVAHAHKMIADGAHIIDVGGESTRPGSERVSLEEELKRVIPVIEALKGFPLSIDTIKPQVAEAAILAGATLINDVSGMQDPNMVRVAAKYQVPVCLMHLEGTTQDLLYNPGYPQGITHRLMEWFERKVEDLQKQGVNQIILDPGIGFGKTIADNVEILHNLHKLKTLGFPVLLGVSRKSFIQKILNKQAQDTLVPTLGIFGYALAQGIDYIRVHDVKEHREILDVLIGKVE